MCILHCAVVAIYEVRYRLGCDISFHNRRVSGAVWHLVNFAHSQHLKCVQVPELDLLDSNWDQLRSRSAGLGSVSNMCRVESFR